jgi:monoamine oxidase
MAFDPDVIIVGAGVAGLAAAGVLTRAGSRVHILEARDRIGGRIFTVHEPGLDHAIELGAEFIHGQPPQILDVLGRASALAAEIAGTDWCSHFGRLGLCDFFEQVEAYLNQMQRTPEDQSFLEFTRRCCPGVSEEIKRRALAYVEGFNAARADHISVNSLVHSRQAEDEIQGDRTFRLAAGYDFVPRMLLAGCEPDHLRLSFSAVVLAVEHGGGKVTVTVRSGESEERLSAPRALITLPLAVLQAGAVDFRPALQEKQAALSLLAMGHVIRVTLLFAERFWAQVPIRGQHLSELRFLFSDDPWFPTWWTLLPAEAPVITGWAPSRAAERLFGQAETLIVQRALISLAALMGRTPAELTSLLRKAYVHDWQADPFARGAYSYLRVGGENAPRLLGAPRGVTLFFAGEATDVAGYFGTVHGAIASGQRAAGEILGSLGSSRAA